MRHHHVERYECEVCGTQFAAEADAVCCEAAGAPTPRFDMGEKVILSGGDYKEQFPGVVWQVTHRDITLDRPGLDLWEEGAPGDHLVTYVIEADCDHCRITFVPEHHLSPAEAKTHA